MHTDWQLFLMQLASGLLAMQAHQELACCNELSAAACCQPGAQALIATALHQRYKVQLCVYRHLDGLKDAVPVLQICPEDALHIKRLQHQCAAGAYCRWVLQITQESVPASNSLQRMVC